MSLSRLCFLPGALQLICTCEGLFPCFSLDCLSGKTGVKKIKFVNDDNTSERPEGRGEKTQMPGNEPNLYTRHELDRGRLFLQFLSFDRSSSPPY